MKEEKKRSFSFLDGNGKRARIEATITYRNGYPEFTASGSFLGSHGQCLYRIMPRTDNQKALIDLWNKYHIKDVSGVTGFPALFDSIIDGIEKEEAEREAKKALIDAATDEKTEDDILLEKMEEEGIDGDMLDAVRAYTKVMGTDDLKDFEESYQGQFSSDEEFAQNMADNLGAVDGKAIWPNNCIDWEYAARELMYDYSEQDGFYFRNL